MTPETIVLKRLSVSLSVESCKYKSQKVLCKVQPTRYAILSRPGDNDSREWFDGGFRATIAKCDLLKIDSATINRVDETRGICTFFIFCLPNDEAQAKMLLLSKINEWINSVFVNTNKMHEHYQNSDL